MRDVKQCIDSMFPQASQIPSDSEFAPPGKPYAEGTLYVVDGELRRWSGATTDALSPICISTNGKTEQRVVGPAAQLSPEAALEALDAAVRAWDRGRGPWPTMRVAERIERVKAFHDAMRGVREQSVRLLMWEIAKTRPDAEKEFDRTLQYIADTIDALKENDRNAARFTVNSGILAQVRRSPLGVVLCMGPYNYPLNETFTTLIPALIMGNTVVVKLPRFGALCQAPLMKCFAESFPKGVVNIINGDGRAVAGPIVESGKIDALAFIGSSRVANILKKQHPALHRCRCVLGLDAKNPAIVLPDADVDLAVKECIAGALSFNGQRCTALKLLFVHRSLAERFVTKLGDAIDALPFGMPWQPGVKLTPLPELKAVERMAGFVENARQHAAKVVNKYGGLANQTFFFPALVYPVKRGMDVYTQEQFGPVVPVVPYDNIDEVLDDVVSSNYGQQASIFGRDAAVIGRLTDVLANQVCRVNLNAQCQRGPDVFPFTGRKDSAEGTLSVSDALRCFSIRSMVAVPENDANKQLLSDVLVKRASNFINTDYLF